MKRRKKERSIMGKGLHDEGKEDSAEREARVGDDKGRLNRGSRGSGQ